MQSAHKKNIHMDKPKITVGFFPNEKTRWRCNATGDCKNFATVFWHYGNGDHLCHEHMHDFINKYEASRKLEKNTYFFVAVRQHTLLAKSILKALRILYAVTTY